MRRQCSCDISLTLDRRHGIFFSAYYEGVTLYAREVSDHVERMVFAAWLCKPLENFGVAYSPTSDVWMARRACVERKCEAQPSVKGCLVTVSPEHPAPCHRADLRTA
jgi:hypothetical protein